MSMTISQAVGRGFRLLYQPHVEFLAALQEPDTTSEIAFRFLAPWQAAAAALQAVQTSLFSGILNFVLGIGITFAAAAALMLISRALHSPIDFRSAFRVNAYSAPVGFVITLLCFVLAKLSVLIAIAGIAYWIYITYVGCKVSMPLGSAVATRATAGTVAASLVVSFILVTFIGGPSGAGGGMLSPDTVAREHIQFREMLHDAHMR